jgi:tetratricopeptide (TPR) repeat protein
MSMLKQIVCGAAIGVAALGAGRADAGQVTPPPPAIAPVPPMPAFVMPTIPPMPPMPPMPAIAPNVWMAMPTIPPMPPMPDFSTIEPALARAQFALDRANFAMAPFAYSSDDKEDQLYDRARDAIENGRYERALEDLNRLLAMNGARADAALYWKVYSLAKIGKRDEALASAADLQKRFKDSKWLKDTKALEVELRQASGQPVSPEAQSDEELKLLALRGLMQSDPDRALPMIEKLLAGTSSIKVKENALFVLSQSRSARAREIIAGVAKGGANPDLQLRAIRFIGMMNSTENRQILEDAYRSTADPAVKRAIIRSYMTSNDKARILGLAKSEKDEALRAEAVRQLGVMRGGAELSELYASEQSPEVKKQILQGMFVGNYPDKLIELAKTEKDPELRKTAIRDLGNMRHTETSDALVSLYNSDANVDVRKTIVNALFVQNNGKALVDIARAEKNIEMKKDIVSKLSIMPKSKEAQDYLLELLK